MAGNSRRCRNLSAVDPITPPESPADSPSNLSDWHGLGDLFALATERIATPVEGVHRAVVNRWFRLGGRRVEPGRRVVDGITASIYGTVRLGAAMVGSAITIGADVVDRRTPLRPVWATRSGTYVQSIFNGLWGDKFHQDQSPFRIQLGLRELDAAQLPVDPESLRRRYPTATSRLVVMLHGFGETERCWASDDPESIVAGLEADGFSVLLVRYNTGRAVSENGADLADLLEAVESAWPTAVSEVALVGHSMGGLVARSAIASGRAAGHGWVEMASHLVAIGTPHLGSPIEKGVRLASDGFGLLEESRPLQDFLDQRSAGIKDLRLGLQEDDEIGTISQHFIAGTVTTASTHPIGRLVGDLVVRVPSATGKGRRRSVEASDVQVVGGRHHAGLLGDPTVATQIREWLGAVPV